MASPRVSQGDVQDFISAVIAAVQELTEEERRELLRRCDIEVTGSATNREVEIAIVECLVEAIPDRISMRLRPPDDADARAAWEEVADLNRRDLVNRLRDCLPRRGFHTPSGRELSSISDQELVNLVFLCELAERSRRPVGLVADAMLTTIWRTSIYRTSNNRDFLAAIKREDYFSQWLYQALDFEQNAEVLIGILQEVADRRVSVGDAEPAEQSLSEVIDNARRDGALSEELYELIKPEPGMQ